MREIKKNIFGKRFAVDCEDSLFELLEESLSGYGDSSGPEPDDVSIRVVRRISSRTPVAVNPKIFSRLPESIITEFPQLKIEWCPSGSDARLSVNVAYSGDPRRLTLRQRLLSTEYPTSVEFFEQLFHELVLVPAMYFATDRAVVHASGLAVNGAGVLLAGTGGVGKTSAALAMRNDPRMSFLTDDIAILDSAGTIFPNLAWPKIYGYNLGNNIDKEELLRDRGKLDRLHFDLRNRINPAKVRRKIRPERLYGRVCREPIPLRAVLFLFKGDSPTFTVEDLDVPSAVRMSLAVMRTEYHHFHRFAYWDVYNSTVLGVKPVLDVEQVMRSWERQLTRAYSGIDLRVVRMPQSMPHHQYVEHVTALLDEVTCRSAAEQLRPSPH